MANWQQAIYPYPLWRLKLARLFVALSWTPTTSIQLMIKKKKSCHSPTFNHFYTTRLCVLIYTLSKVFSLHPSVAQLLQQAPAAGKPGFPEHGPPWLT